MSTLSALLAARDFVLGDGATGTQLQARGLSVGCAESPPPEIWNVLAPEIVSSVIEGYLDAGSAVVETNSFGANKFRLATYASHDMPQNCRSAMSASSPRDLARSAAAIARSTVDLFASRSPGASRPLVAGSVGPLGDLLKPLGPVDPVEARAAFVEQVAGLREGGADFVLLETFTAIEEVREAVAACREAWPGAEVCATMTFNVNKKTGRARTMMGVSPAQLLALAEEAGLVACGLNCGCGPQEAEAVLAQFVQARGPESRVALISQANAGLPSVDGTYSVGPADMAEHANRARALGAKYIGCCCGSGPQHIRAMRNALGCPENKADSHQQ